MPHAFAQRGADRPGVAVVAIGCDPVRCHAGHRLGGTKERLRGRHVAVFTEQHVDQVPVPVDSAIQIAPAPVHLQVRFIDVPAAAHLATPAPSQLLGQGRVRCGRFSRSPGLDGQGRFFGVDVELVSSIVAISAIALLRAFMKIGSEPLNETELSWLILVHLTFVTSGVLLALMDFLASRSIRH